MTLATGYAIINNMGFVRLESLIGEDARPFVALITESVPFRTLWARALFVLKLQDGGIDRAMGSFRPRAVVIAMAVRTGNDAPRGKAATQARNKVISTVTFDRVKGSIRNGKFQGDIRIADTEIRIF
jgi:hypothetical protein